MPVRLGQLEIHVELNEISGPAGRQRLEPQAVTVLELLVREPGRVWSRDDILDGAWAGRVVSDATLTGVISRLRRALTEAGITDVRIETRSKRGYVLVLSETSPVSHLRRWLLPSGLVSILLLGGLAAGVPHGLQPDLESVDGVRLDFDITFPDGEMSDAAIWLKDGSDGGISLAGDHPLDIRVIPAVSGNGLLRLRIEAAGLAHWIGFEQVIALGTEGRFTLKSEKTDAVYAIRFVASRGPLPAGHLQ